MIRTDCWNRLAAMLGLSLVLSVVPACTASAGHGFLRRPGSADGAAPQAPYIAYRPVFPAPVRKPFVLSNYAGYNYPSNLPGAVVTPTDFRILTGKAVAPQHGWFGSGW